MVAEEFMTDREKCRMAKPKVRTMIPGASPEAFANQRSLPCVFGRLAFPQAANAKETASRPNQAGAI